MDVSNTSSFRVTHSGNCLTVLVSSSFMIFTCSFGGLKLADVKIWIIIIIKCPVDWPVRLCFFISCNLQQYVSVLVMTYFRVMAIKNICRCLPYLCFHKSVHLSQQNIFQFLSSHSVVKQRMKITTKP